MTTQNGELPYSLGLDIGSTTVKLVILDKEQKLVYADYKRHMADPRSTLTELLQKAAETFPDLPLCGACTGSGGIALAKSLGLHFVQEVIAGTKAVKSIIPQTDVVIELGGEDAKITFFGNTIEQRMNETCAGGTGAFIDQMASYLHTDAQGLNELAKDFSTIYPIASRCGVFAESDVLALLNEGANRKDIAASIFQAVVDQIVGGLACGRSIEGKIAFLGGPLFFLSELRKRFQESLKLFPEHSVFPEHAQYFVAIGAALEGLSLQTKDSIFLPQILALLKTINKDKTKESQSLPALFETEEAIKDFSERHKKEASPKKNMQELSGPVFLGFDAGSTTIKAVLTDAEGAIAYTFYDNNRGMPLVAAKKALEEIYAQLPKEAYIASAGATGYGAGLLKAALGLENEEVETIAHFKAANFLCPSVSFILDIGGQDMKCLHIKEGIIDKIMLNEACSAGCGVFIESYAKSLGIDKKDFSALALSAKNPVDLGSRCTVFMNSKIKQAQKEGAELEDIAAGLAYSVIRNALYKVIKVAGPEDLGSCVVAQGGTFLSDAILRAFEQLLGCEVFRPDISGLMGAYGMALFASETPKTLAKVLPSEPLKSGIISQKDLESFSHKAETRRCNLCGNRCLLTINIFPNGQHITGNRCERGASKSEPSKKAKESTNLFAKKYDLLFKERPSLAQKSPSRGRIGIPRALNIFDRYPYWQAFLSFLGFEIVLSDPSSKELYAKGLETISSQSVCFPAKLANGHIVDLIHKGVKHIFYPCISHEYQEFDDADNCYNCPVIAGYPEILPLNINSLKEEQVELIAPFLNMNEAKALRAILYKSLQSFGVSKAEINKALEAAEEAQAAFKQELRRLGEEALRELEENKGSGIVLIGHPYHIDPAIHHGIPELISNYGATVFTEDSIAHLYQESQSLRILDQWPYHSRLFRAAAFAAKHQQLELVQFTSFGCGLDAISTDQVQEILEEAQKIYTLLKIDEGANLGGVRIRIRSLLATVQEQRAKALKEQDKKDRVEKCTNCNDCAGQKELGSEENTSQRSVFTQEMGKDYTFLAPQMSPVHFQFLEKVMEHEGYKVELLPYASQEDVEEGLRFVNNDACYPAIMVIGQLVRALRSGKYNMDKTALLISQTGGSCRASNYIALLRLALQKSGLAHVPVLSFNTVQLEEQPGFVVSTSMLMRMILGILYGDMIEKLTLRTRPYEAHIGASDALYKKWSDICTNSLHDFGNKLFARNIEAMLHDFASVPITNEQKPRVGMVGEILIKYHPDANNQTIQVIEAEGGEAVPTEFANFMLYCLYDNIDFKRHSFAKSLKALKNRFSIRWIEKKREIIRKALKNYPRFGHVPTIHELAESCKGLVSLGHQGGEGWLLTAEMVEMLQTDVPNIICMQPFACLPNHITGKGVIRELSRRYPKANIVPVDYDPGASEVNQLNRIKLMMATARQSF